MMASTPDALQCRGDITRASNLQNQVHRTDVNSHLKRRRGDNGPKMTVFETLFNIQADVLVHRTVVPCNEVAEVRAKFLHNGFRHFSCVCKNQRRGVSTDEICNRFNVVLKNLENG